MKLIIQIPCFNEAETLPGLAAELPRQLEGIDIIEWLVIDDGSTDRTIEVAREVGVDHVVRHMGNKGLASAFQTGLNACLGLGADIIVNTDADNQYPSHYIPELVRPILEHKADMVIADRQIHTIPHFSPVKKSLQSLGSRVVRMVSGTTVPDAPSGFRAMSRETALRLNVVTGYTYTLETIIQAGKRNLTIAHVPIHINPKTRESRLIRNIPDYVMRSMITIIKVFVLYEPLRTFSWISMPFALVGGGLWLRYLLILLSGEAERGAHVQSVLVGSVALLTALLIFLIGVLGDLNAINRRLSEETLYYVKRMAFDQDAKARDSVREEDTQPTET